MGDSLEINDVNYFFLFKVFQYF